jgi:hypothetical protein
MQANLVNGWREVLARIFDGFDVEYGVTPDWLVNPETNRRLKLDCLYGDIGLAIRFVGLEGTQRKQRKSDEEVLSEQEREAARAEVCQQHGVVLVSIDPDGEPRTALRNIETGLIRASAQLAQQNKAPSAKRQKLMPLLSLARQRTGEFTAKLNPPDRLNMYAEMWWERQASVAAQAPVAKTPGKTPKYTVGMSVYHQKFGPGQITAMMPDGKDTAVTVSFGAEGEKTFLASLVVDKLMPQ